MASLEWSSLVPDQSQAPLRGGMGTVYKAHWTRCKVDVAVKLLRASELSLEDYAAAARALKAEAEKLRLASEGSNNRYVVALLGAAHGAPSLTWRECLGDEIVLYSPRSRSSMKLKAAPCATCGSRFGNGGSAAEDVELFGLVMKWESGGTLAERLHDPAAKWAAKTADRVLLLEQIAESVKLLHMHPERSIVHGDLKSDNCMLSSRGATFEPRLSDFGLAEIKKAAATVGASSVRAAAAVVGGTWQYKAPELYRRRNEAAQQPSRSSDVFALGTLSWEVLVGERPWLDYDEAERVMDLRTGDSLDWSRLPSDVPASLRGVLVRCVALKREDRPSALDFCEALRSSRELLTSGNYDVFLSLVWEGNAPS